MSDTYHCLFEVTGRTRGYIHSDIGNLFRRPNQHIPVKKPVLPSFLGPPREGVTIGGKYSRDRERWLRPIGESMDVRFSVTLRHLSNSNLIGTLNYRRIISRFSSILSYRTTSLSLSHQRNAVGSQDSSACYRNQPYIQRRYIQNMEIYPI
jgi:hypothetical protein